MPSDFKSISDIFRGNAFSHVRKAAKENDAIENFTNIFPELKKLVRAYKVNKGVLFLSVENSVVRNELYLNKSIMIEKLNKNLKEKIIDDIKFSSFRK